MKKIILTILLLFLALPCFAGNLLQQEYETAKMSEMAQEPAFYNLSKRGLIENDYSAYFNGGGSLYGVLKYKQGRLPKNSLDLKYVNLILAKYDIIIKNRNSQLIQPDKIIVDDKDYKMLSDDVKSDIAVFNIIIFK